MSDKIDTYPSIEGNNNPTATINAYLQTKRSAWAERKLAPSGTTVSKLEESNAPGCRYSLTVANAHVKQAVAALESKCTDATFDNVIMRTEPCEDGVNTRVHLTVHEANSIANSEIATATGHVSTATKAHVTPGR